MPDFAPLQSSLASPSALADSASLVSGDDSLLDNPIWNALRTEHRTITLGDERARRYPADIGPLSGIPSASRESYKALRALAGPGGIVVLFCQDRPQPPAGWSLIRGGVLSQMVCLPQVTPSATDLRSDDQPSPEQLRPLTQADVPAMVALAELTEPGPFRERTIELGHFWGIFTGDRLLAMAGQRLHLPHHVEVSAVCTHPDARGRGYARRLMSTVMDEIRGRGKTPFLHTFADNHSAIRVYQSLGYTLRRNFHLAVLKNDA
jgi:ribosomal protein S18 acetylase RimI-like enzyme